MQLLMIRVLESAHMAETAGDCLRRILSSLSSGILFNRELLDVNNETNLFEKLDTKQKHSITFKAQELLRFLSFRVSNQFI
jgi:hypothetical protein